MKKPIAVCALVVVFVFLLITAVKIHPFGEPKTRAYVFSLSSPEYRQYMKDGSVNTTLRQAFYNNNISLSESAYISTVDEKNWKIINSHVEPPSYVEYQIEDAGTELKISTLIMDDYFIKNAQNQTGTNNVCTSIVFDYRGYDTLGEATVLFTAVTGVALLFRREKE